MARPLAGTSTFCVAIAFPFTTSETVFVAAGVSKPAITASHARALGIFGSDSSAGALTLSTVQFGGAAPCATGCSTSLTLPGNTMSAKLAGIAVRCMSLKRCRSIGARTVSLMVRRRATELAEVGMAVAGLNALERRAQLRIVGDRLREYIHLAAEGDDLRLLRVRFCGQRGERLLLGIGKARSGAHAEGIVEHDEQLTAVGIGCWRAARRDWQRPAQ